MFSSFLGHEKPQEDMRLFRTVYIEFYALKEGLQLDDFCPETTAVTCIFEKSNDGPQNKLKVFQ